MTSRTLNLPIPDVLEELTLSFFKPYEFYRLLTEKFLWEELGPRMGDEPLRVLAGLTEELLLDSITHEEYQFWKSLSHKTGDRSFAENLMNMRTANATRHFLMTGAKIFSLLDLEYACIFIWHERTPTFPQRQTIRLILDAATPEALRHHYFTGKECSVTKTGHYLGGYLRLLLLKHNLVTYDSEKDLILPGRNEVSESSPVRWFVASEAPCTEEFRELLSIQPGCGPHILNYIFHSPIITHMMELGEKREKELETERSKRVGECWFSRLVFEVKNALGL